MKRIVLLPIAVVTFFSFQYKEKTHTALPTFSLKIPFARASSDTSPFFKSGWSAMGFVLGYGDRDAYIEYSCGGEDPGEGNECDGPPEIGLVRKFTEIAESVFHGLEVEDCSSFPTSGSQTIEVDAGDAEVKFSEATQKIPDGWEGGGEKFDRRLEANLDIVGSPMTMVIEVSCKYDKTAMAAMNMEVGEHAPGYTRPINVWLGAKDSKTVADIYVSEVDVDADTVRGAYAFGLIIDEEAKTYQLWGSAGVQYDDGGSNSPVDLYNLTGNFETHEFSMRVKRFVAAEGNTGENGGSYLDIDSLEGIDGSDEADVPETSTFTLLTAVTPATGATATAQGCMDFDEPTTAPSSADSCEDLDWDDAPTPVLDADGAFSPAWAYGTMHKKLKEIPDLPE